MRVRLQLRLVSDRVVDDSRFVETEHLEAEGPVVQFDSVDHGAFFCLVTLVYYELRL